MDFQEAYRQEAHRHVELLREENLYDPTWPLLQIPPSCSVLHLHYLIDSYYTGVLLTILKEYDEGR